MNFIHNALIELRLRLRILVVTTAETRKVVGTRSVPWGRWNSAGVYKMKKEVLLRVSWSGMFSPSPLSFIKSQKP